MRHSRGVLPGLTLAAAAGGAAAASPLGTMAAASALLVSLVLVALEPPVVAGLLVAASFFSGVSIPVGELNLRPEQVAGLLVGLTLVARRKLAAPPAAALLAAAWLAAGLFGALGEPESGRAVLHAARLGATILPLALLPMLLADRRSAERGWDLFLLLSSLEALVGAGALGAHVAFGTELGVTVEKVLGYAHAQGTLLEPNFLGASSAAAAGALALRAFDGSLRRRSRFLAAIGVGLCALGLAASLTRAAVVALGVVLVPALALSTRPGARLRRIGIVAAAALLLAALAAPLVVPFVERLPTDGRQGVLGRLTSLSRVDEDPNVRVRLRSYEAAIGIWRGSPLVGAGHGALERIAGTEDRALAWAGNLEVHALADTGLVGLAALSALLLLAVSGLARDFRRERDGDRRRRSLERLAAISIALVAAQATEPTWLAWFWVLVGLSFAATRPEAAPSSVRDVRPIRILFVHPSDELYGSDRVLLDLVTRLDRSRFEPRVVLSNDLPYAGRLTGLLRARGVDVRSLRIGVLRRRVLSPRRAPRYALDVALSTFRLVRILRRERIDLVHANTVTVFPAALAAKLAGVPLLWHVHEIVTERFGRGLIHRLVGGLADRIVVVSEAARASLDPDERLLGIDVVPNGVEVPAAPIAPLPDPPVVAYVGRLSRRKGPELLLRAAAEILRDHPAARVLFAGDEVGGGRELTDALLAEARALGIESSIEIRPFRDDVSDVYRGASVIVSPSVRPESFGLVLLEAMAAGRAVVASDLGGPREVVADGRTGRLVPPGDPRALAEAISSILSDPALARRMGKAGRERAAERFAIAASVRRFELIYVEMARRAAVAVPFEGAKAATPSTEAAAPGS